jgi:hypothetical protein
MGKVQKSCNPEDYPFVLPVNFSIDIGLNAGLLIIQIFILLSEPE